MYVCMYVCISDAASRVFTEDTIVDAGLASNNSERYIIFLSCSIYKEYMYVCMYVCISDAVSRVFTEDTIVDIELASNE